MTIGNNNKKVDDKMGEELKIINGSGRVIEKG